MLADPVDGIADALEIAERLGGHVGAPIRIGDAVFRVSASTGIALQGHDPVTPDGLLGDADLALYEAKRYGAGQIVVCDDRLRLASLRRPSSTAPFATGHGPRRRTR